MKRPCTIHNYFARIVVAERGSIFSASDLRDGPSNIARLLESFDKSITLLMVGRETSLGRRRPFRASRSSAPESRGTCNMNALRPVYFV